MKLVRELEVCAETLQACNAASRGGADRIELCSALDVGGVTPSTAFLGAATLVSGIPIHALIRPRAGHFVYTDAEFRILCAEAEDALDHGATGIVTGVLTASREVDQPRMQQIVRIAAGRPVTFHRAFDRTRDLSVSLETVIDLGCSRILTSGGQPNVTAGFDMLQALAQQADGRIRIAAGSGVSLRNAAQLCTIAGLDLHGSFRGPSGSAHAGDPLWDDDPAKQLVQTETVRAISAVVHATEQLPGGTRDVEYANEEHLAEQV